jgi:hypothetical protein
VIQRSPLSRHVHSLFDAHLIGVADRGVIFVHLDARNVKGYGDLHGRSMRLPSSTSDHPSKVLLDAHIEIVKPFSPNSRRWRRARKLAAR